METTRLSSKGQVVLPKPVRDTLGWTQGMEFAVVASKEGVLLRPLNCFASTRLRDVIGAAGYSGRRVTAEEMNDAIRTAARGRSGHGRYDGHR